MLHSGLVQSASESWPSGIRYGDVPLHLAPAGAQFWIIYLRDYPSEVPNVVIRFFFTFVGDRSIVHAPSLPRVA